MANDTPTRATPTQIRTFFETSATDKVGARELMGLKKDQDGKEIPDYDQIATGLGNGSLTY
jgi:hypothetical protein